ncbi:hypothetical protein AQUCO_00700058v1 [Aquilegia coerulea]|uniref:Uncharacterized protein n=1 Tax=Aquilegia coerulea TaxID=218851 RepID=A0A2G5EIB1_AQUCA|nr:hypothetical protein AQUCO_00700058v1 [Aquilegia coerulea]
MDKARQMKRQLNKQQSGNNNNNKLNSSYNKDNSEMDCESDGEEEEELLRPHSSRNKAGTSNSTKKFKLHNSKSFIDRNGVDHSKVPRRLRSAMCKRNRDSLSPPLSYIKKPHHTALGMEAPRMNGTTDKFKQNSKQEVEVGRIISGTITKDEEEVAETLFSLARMSPDENPVDSKAVRRMTEEKSSPLQDTKECSQLPDKASQEESMPSQLVCSGADRTSQSSNLKGSSEPNSWSGLTIMGRPIGYGNNKFELPLGSSAALAGLVRASLPSRESNTDAIPLADPSELGVSSEFCHLIGPLHLAQHDVSLRKQSIENGPWPVPNANGKEDPQQPALAYNGSGALLACREGTPYLWPGMSRGQSCGGEVHGPSRWSPSTKVSAWLDSAIPSTRNGSTESTVFTEKVKPVIVDQKQSRKRCATHMYISRLIQAYQSAEKKPKWPVHPTHLNLNERTRFGVMTTNDLIGRRTDLDRVMSLESTNVLNGYTSMGSANHSFLGKSSNELESNNSQERRLQRDHQLSITSSGTYSAEKKNCEFLSLSSGGGGLKHVATTTCDSHQQRNGSVPSPQIQAPYLYPVQHHPLMPFSLPHARPASPQSQLPQYMTNPYYYSAHPGHAKQQLEQQRQMVWATHMTSQYTPGGTSSASLIPCAQPSFSSSPLELLNAKGSQQHQSSFPSSMMGKREHHPLSGGGLQSDASPKLQLVCGAEHI